MITKTFPEIPFHSSHPKETLQLVLSLGVLDLRNQIGFLAAAHPPHHFQSSREKTTKACFAQAPSLPPPPTHTHTLLHQALLGLVGLRMEHDDRQKQSSAPPCTAVFYSVRA